MKFLLIALPLLSQNWDECRYTAPREATVDAASAARIVVTAGSGSLEVVGRPGLRQARIRATACASDQQLLSEIRLTATRSGGEVRVHANDQDLDLRNREYARLDVVIEVPEGLAADIDDGSGEIDLTAIGALTLNDGSGSITGDDIRGNVVIEDGSGEINIRGVKGDVQIDDGSGGIDLRNVDGAVDIRDGSGEIQLFKVLRDVTLSDSSGSIDVDEVGGNFTVRNDSSGSIDYHAVRGAVRVPRGKYDRDDDEPRWLSRLFN